MHAEEHDIPISDLDLSWGDIKEEYRSCISFLKSTLSLNAESSSLPFSRQLPEDTTFTVVLEIDEASEVPLQVFKSIELIFFMQNLTLFLCRLIHPGYLSEVPKRRRKDKISLFRIH